VVVVAVAAHCRAACERPGERAVAAEGVHPSLTGSWCVLQNVRTAVAVEVADPEGAAVVDAVAEPGRVAHERPGELAVVAERAQPPIVVKGGVEQNARLLHVLELTDPEGAAGLASAEPHPP